MKYILPLLLFCVPAQAEVVREMSNLVTKDNVNGAVALNGVTTIPGGSFSVGTSTFVVTGGQTSIASNATQPVRIQTNPSGDYELRVNQAYNGADYAGQIQNITGGSAGPLALNPSGGNVGIGTTSPASKVDISSGTIRMAGTGAPTVGKALCLTAAGVMGTCSDTPAANGACTCVAP